MDFWNSIWAAAGGFSPRPWLAPLSPLYAAAAALHRAWRRARGPSGQPQIPLVVIGSLRAGGAGKTPVTEAMALHYAARGLRVAVLAYRLGPGRRNPVPPGKGLEEVFPDSDWRLSSEEAVLLARAGAGAFRVFATRDRPRAWRSLASASREGGEGFDLILTDDGFQDPRLGGAFRILLRGPGEEPGLFDLLPAGPFRQTARAAAGADLVLRGPLPWEGPATGAPEADAPADSNAQVTLPFHARMLLPEPARAGGACAAFCALGDNRRFLADLAAAGLPAREALEAPDHAAFPEARLEAFARRHAGWPLVCTRKDFLKLPPGAADRLRIRVAEREIALPPGLFEAVDRYRAGFAAERAALAAEPAPLRPAGNLVH